MTRVKERMSAGAHNPGDESESGVQEKQAEPCLSDLLGDAGFLGGLTSVADAGITTDANWFGQSRTYVTSNAGEAM